MKKDWQATRLKYVNVVFGYTWTVERRIKERRHEWKTFSFFFLLLLCVFSFPFSLFDANKNKKRSQRVDRWDIRAWSILSRCTQAIVAFQTRNWKDEESWNICQRRDDMATNISFLIIKLCCCWISRHRSGQGRSADRERQVNSFWYEKKEMNVSCSFRVLSVD